MNKLMQHNRLFATGAMLVAVFVVVASALAVQQKDQPTHDGTVVSITGTTLVMASADAKEHSHTLAIDAKVTLDGKTCVAADLKPGTRIRVTTEGADQSVVTAIEALDKNQAFASNRSEGKVISITGDTLVMTGIDAKKDRTWLLTSEVKITCDGEVCETTDLKRGMKIRVTSRKDNPNAVVLLEAIDKNLAFASDQQDGKVVSVKGDQLVMTGDKSEEELTRTLSSDVKITCDGKVCKASDLKPGMRIRVTSRSDDSNHAIRIEAIEKNREFASL